MPLADFQKSAFVRDWIRSSGNKWFESNIDNMLTDPTKRQELFGNIRNHLTGEKPKSSFLSYLNPMAYVRSAYTSDPRAQAFMKKTIKSRLQDPRMLAKMFPNAKVNWGQLLGPMGTAGLATAGAGLAAGSSMLGLAGLGMTGMHAYNQYQKAVDPMTWARAFAAPRNAQEAVQQSKAHSLLGSVAALTGKYGSADFQKRALNFGGGIQRTKTDHNAVSNSIMNQHFSVPVARDSIAKATNLSMHDKFRMMGSLNSSVKQKDVSPSGSLRLRDFLPALAGAGLGYVGASLAAPIFGMSRTTQKRMGIGGGALGALANSFPQWKKWI